MKCSIMLHFICVYTVLKSTPEYKGLKNNKAELNCEQEKESIICVRMRQKNPSLRITICHHFVNLIMPNSDPRDKFFYHSLTLLIDSDNVYLPNSSFYNRILTGPRSTVGNVSGNRSRGPEFYPGSVPYFHGD